ncbi:MAG: hypothetical protein MK515_05625 [SAR324 cluster bacterium]|jgi:hypothetical protein|nr:hypothetical protein [SAR324 cluster bacterium]|tara:strand:+ start:337 stop:759 length:423 start_codon:yes stop_codon:yes gene_type:complete
MSSSSQTNSLGSETTSIEDQDEFSQVVCDGRSLLENKVEFQTEEWAWTCDLDDGGIFVFSYLLYDYKQKVLSLARLKESVYTLNLLRHKMLPEQAKTGLSMLGEFQVIFTLYERLKLEEMSWGACEDYVKELIEEHRRSN